MDRISIQDLKGRLSAVVAEAQAGSTIVVTRHNEPVARIGPTRSTHEYRGARVARGRLEAAVADGTNGRYLEALLEDRGAP